MGIFKKLSPFYGAYKSHRKSRSKDIEKNKQIEKGQKMAIKKEKKAYPFYKQGLKELEAELQGKHGIPSELGDIMHRYERATKGAEKFYAPIKEQALQEFSQVTSPEIFGKFGREQGAGSSALNQALAAARTNLSRQLASDFAGFQTQYAGNLLNTSQQGKLANLQQRSNIANAAIGQPSAYTPPLEMAPSGWQKYGSLGTGVLGGVLGGLAAGPGGAVAGFQGGTQLGQTIFNR